MDKTYKAIQYKVTTHHDAVVDKREESLEPDFTAGELLKVWRGR
ncbi:hypothetical protein SAMN05216390_1301 [Lachnospiraceae bacterium KH1T2]|nr:hypothetical protein SAMN05216390_1301 [Lachnospiraceae bacterium KH1T2]